MDAARSQLANAFRECAQRFRRIAQRTEADVSSELASASAMAGKCLKRGADLGVYDMPNFLPWPNQENGLHRPDSSEREWCLRWTSFAFIIDRAGIGELPANLMAQRIIDGGAKAATFIVDVQSSRQRAENFAAICDWLATLADKADGRQPKRRRLKKPRGITDKQALAIQTVAECKGNIADAAKILGKDRATVKEAYDAGLRKIGTDHARLMKKIQDSNSTSLPMDHRGQLNVSSKGYRPGGDRGS